MELNRLTRNVLFASLLAAAALPLQPKLPEPKLEPLLFRMCNGNSPNVILLDQIGKRRGTLDSAIAVAKKQVESLKPLDYRNSYPVRQDFADAGSILRKGEGDCLERSVLAASALRLMGFNAEPVMLRLSSNDFILTHAAVLLSLDGREIYLDFAFDNLDSSKAQTPEGYGHFLLYEVIRLYSGLLPPEMIPRRIIVFTGIREKIPPTEPEERSFEEGEAGRAHAIIIVN